MSPVVLVFGVWAVCLAIALVFLRGLALLNAPEPVTPTRMADTLTETVCAVCERPGPLPFVVIQNGEFCPLHTECAPAAIKKGPPQ